MSTKSFEERYQRQLKLAELGHDGQRKLAEGSALIVGCGALGSNLANTIVRAGVGRTCIVDRDVVELSNLPRQLLFDEDDVAAAVPKAKAAVRRLTRINSTVEVEGRVEEVTARNVEALAAEMDLVLDATDNMETRYLINDACVKLGKPWIYGGVLGTTGMTLTIVPGAGPCLRCIFPTPPAPGSLPTPETHGVLGTAPALIAALQATEAIKILAGGEPSPRLLSIELWSRTIQQLEVLRDADCPACGQRRFEFLEQPAKI